MATTQSRRRVRRASVKADRPQTSGVEHEELTRAERDAFFAQMRGDLERLQTDPEAWADYQREARVFLGLP